MQPSGALPAPTSDLTPVDSVEATHLVALSATYRDLPTDAREALASAIVGTRDPLQERVVLHTCHRVELVGVLKPDARVPELSGARIATGLRAVERVFLVTGGLDSAVLAEEQVLGQVRSAYDDALGRGETGPVLNELYRRAIRFGKRVRSEVQPRNDRSLADRTVRWIAERLGPEVRPASALVLGTGEMGRLLASRLAGHGMTITIGSRSLARARRTAEELPNASRHRSMMLEEAVLHAAQHDVVAIAVRSASTPLDRHHLETSRPLPLVVDLSAPRAVTSGAADLLGDRLLDLDRLGTLSATQPLSTTAEQRLRAAAREGAARFVDWWSTRTSGDGIALLRAHAAEIRERHLRRLRRRPDMTPEQLAAVETATAAMLGELLHVPTLRLRRDPDARAVVSHVFGIEP